MLDGRFRIGVDRCVRPFGSALVRTRVAPDHLTAFGLLLSVPTAVVVASGHLAIGLLLVVFSAVPDLLDGALAKASGRASVRGAFFDSVCDRVTDTFVLGGIAWYLQDRHHGHAFMLPFAILGASLLISYERAKAESLGFEAKGGLMERAERIVLVCVGLAFPVLLIPVLWVMLALTIVTAVQRFAKVWRQASGPSRPVPASPPRPAVRRRSPAWLAPDPAVDLTASRWRARHGRSDRYARGSHRSGSASRWRERRVAREERRATERGVDGRWRGSRRP